MTELATPVQVVAIGDGWVTVSVGGQRPKTLSVGDVLLVPPVVVDEPGARMNELVEAVNHHLGRRTRMLTWMRSESSST